MKKVSFYWAWFGGTAHRGSTGLHFLRPIWALEYDFGGPGLRALLRRGRAGRMDPDLLHKPPGLAQRTLGRADRIPVGLSSCIDYDAGRRFDRMDRRAALSSDSLGVVHVARVVGGKFGFESLKCKA